MHNWEQPNENKNSTQISTHVIFMPTLYLQKKSPEPPDDINQQTINDLWGTYFTIYFSFHSF